ncbi:MAG: DNA cytosine methyltransferase, partial [Chloroflexi bacterium]|nr:DNA cytosine methyltransferase [Chloroflexota bacterium]
YIRFLRRLAVPEKHPSGCWNSYQKMSLSRPPPDEEFEKLSLHYFPTCSRMIGENRAKYEADDRHHLYKQYLKILAKHQPPVFIMENVKGLISATLNGENTFELIQADLKNPTEATQINTDKPAFYKLFSVVKEISQDEEVGSRDFVVRAENYAIPQSRHRVIILGIREDFHDTSPDILQEKHQVFIEEVIGDLPKLRSGLSKEEDSLQIWHEVIKEIPNQKWIEDLDIDVQNEIRDFAKLGKVTLNRGGKCVLRTASPEKHTDWYLDEKLNGVCNHETRAHIRKDLHRYFFSAVYTKVHKRFPRLVDYPLDLLPNHKNAYEARKNSKFADRFRVQLEGQPSTTIVSHISKDGHYFIHYDPTQCRSLTVREAARLQTFPDNYFFEGPRTHQYHQVGNAVPPLLAKQIAEIVAKLFE